MFLHDYPDRSYLLTVYERKPEPDLLAPSSSADDWFRAGLARMQAGQFADALFAFQASLELEPGNPAARTNLAYCLADLERYEEEADAFAEVVSRHPTHHEAWYGLAQAKEALGRRREAIELWSRYLAAAPEGPWKERARQRLEQLERR